jgi:hypothetical protein
LLDQVISISAPGETPSTRSLAQSAQNCALSSHNPVKPGNPNNTPYALSDALLLRKLGNRLAAQYGLRPAS